MDIKKGQKFLDLGGGIATTVNYITQNLGPRGEIVIIEPDINCSKNVENNKDDGYPNYQLLKLEKEFISEDNPINYPDNYFDITYTSRILCQNPNYIFLLKELLRVTKVGGKIINSCFDHSSYRSSLTNDFLESLYKLLFRIVHGESFNFLRNSNHIYKSMNIETTDFYFENVLDTKVFTDNFYSNFKDQLKRNFNNDFVFNLIVSPLLDIFLSDVLSVKDNKFDYSVFDMGVIIGTKTKESNDFLKENHLLKKT